tara:strand:+ start:139 stop:543 length:405 start_codon:yes stop_codon:yes gene_type:complete
MGLFKDLKTLFGSKKEQTSDFPKAPNFPLPMKPLLDEKVLGLIGIEFAMYLSWVEDTTRKSIMGKELERRIKLFLNKEKKMGQLEDFNEGDIAFINLMATASDFKTMQKARKEQNLDSRWPKMEKHIGLKKKKK